MWVPTVRRHCGTEIPFGRRQIDRGQTPCTHARSQYCRRLCHSLPLCRSVCRSHSLLHLSHFLSCSLTRALLSIPHTHIHSLWISLSTGAHTHTHTSSLTHFVLSLSPCFVYPCVVDPLGRDTSRNITLVELLDPLGRPSLLEVICTYTYLHADQPTHLHLLTTNSSPIPPLGANLRSVLSVPPNPRLFFPTIASRVCDRTLSTKLPRSILEASPGSTRIQSLDRLGPTGPGIAAQKKVQSHSVHTLAPLHTYLDPSDNLPSRLAFPISSPGPQWSFPPHLPC